MSSSEHITEPVIDRIPRVDDAVSVGEDLNFQRRWWQFEKVAWAVLVLVLIADALGVFGRGWLARAHRDATDGTLHVRYERVERAGTPSEITLEFGPAAVHDKTVRLFANETIVKQLGAQRIIPEPTVSEIGPDGITYAFSVSGSPAIARIALEPSFPGIHHIELRVPGADTIHASILVLP